MTDSAAARGDRMEKAAHWWAHFQETEPSEEQVLQWLAWLEESPENAECFEQMNQFARQLYRTRETHSNKSGRLRSPPLHPRRGQDRGSFFKPSLAASIVLAAGLLSASAWLLTSAWSTERVTYTTSVADQRAILLPDGSHVTLGGASTVRTVFSSSTRKVQLSGGEAYFEVKPNSAGRPFIVDTGVAAVQVLGTAFNVRRNDRKVAVTVAEGRVKVVHSGGILRSLVEWIGVREPSAVEAGSNQQVIAEADTQRLRTIPADARGASAWRQGRLEFSDETLDIVIENVSRYSPVRIRAADSRLRDITYTGTFVPGQADSWLAALEQVFDLRVQRGSDLISVYRRQPAP